MPRARKRVSDNLQPLGILWVVFGVYRIVATVVAAVTFQTLARNGMFGEVPPFLQELAGGLLPVIGVLIGAIGLLTMATGWALLTRRPWARTLAIVMGILALLKVPLGTGLGIYTLWVLAPRASAAEWQELAEAEPMVGVA